LADSEIISCLYLPIDGGNLLLPNVSVAEVIEYVVPERKVDGPEYYLGHIQWRGTSVPLLSYERANGNDKAPPSTLARIAVLNSVGTDNKKLPFISVVTQGLPRLVKVSTDIIQNSAESSFPAEKCKTTVEGESAVIPDLSFLESLAIDLA